jgi:hypothetical protein
MIHPERAPGLPRAAAWCLTLTVLVLSAAGPVAARDPGGKETFSFHPQYLPGEEVVEILVPLFPGVHFNQDPYSGLITTDITPNRLEPLQQVLDLLDVPRDPVDLMIHVVWGGEGSFRGAVPEELKPVAGELRRRFSCDRYEVENTLFLPVLERGRGKVQMEPGYMLEYAVDRVEPASGEIDIRLDVSRLSIMGDRIGTILQTNQRLHPDLPETVGGVRLAPQQSAIRQGDAVRYEKTAPRTLILVIQASLPDNPTKTVTLIDEGDG